MTGATPAWRRVTQTRTGFPAGNCTEAALASLLGCDIEDVPVLWSGDMGATTDDDAQPPERFAAMLDWLHDRGWEWREWRLAEPVAPPVPEAAYLAASGWRGGWSAPHFLAGPNQDGIAHMVIGSRGVVLWDPNPTRRGIVAVTHIGQLWPVEKQ